jgi:tRNA A37 threonylcarbamoyladenosine modification protein TsaB
MNILSIECSGARGSVAVVAGGAIQKLWEFESPRGRGNALFTHLESALGEFRSPGRVVVGTGPGSYNGLRASIAAAWGVARACGAEWGGVSSLLGYDAPEYFVAGDARAGQCFLARVTAGEFFSAPELVPAADLPGHLLAGIPVFATSGLASVPEAVVCVPSAAVLATRRFVAGRPLPIYLKPPHITKPSAGNQPVLRGSASS